LVWLVSLFPHFLIQTDFSDQGNGGDGGDASSGDADADGPNAKAYSGAGGNAAGGDVDRREPDMSTHYPNIFSRGQYAPAHSDASEYSPKGVDERHYIDVVNVGSGTYVG
jgi:hypothetical protein